MMEYLRQFRNAVIMGVVIFLALTGIHAALGHQITWDDQRLEHFVLTMMYTIVLYMANAAVFIILNKVFRKDKYSLKRLLIGFVSSFAVTVVFMVLLRIVTVVLIKQRSFAEFLENETIANYVVSMLITLFISLAIHAFYFYKQIQENRVKEQRVIAGTASAKFESLKNQIDPHFLFNSLNVLSSLIEENPENAQRFTSSLSKIYRYVLEQKDKELVSLSEELDFARTYMKLLKMRFEDSLFYELPEVDIDPEMKVVPLSLQLLLENTVKHNVVSEKKPLYIKIFIDGNYLGISNGFQKKEVLQDRQGVGLQNIVSRYAIITDRKVLVEQNEKTFTVKIPILTKLISIMETDDQVEKISYYKAQKKVEEIKGFYGNLGGYIVVMIILAIVNLATYPQFLWFLFPLAGWGIGVLVHGLSVFNYLPFLGSDWEDRKIREIMERDKSAKWN